jgi:hypothetical protein
VVDVDVIDNVVEGVGSVEACLFRDLGGWDRGLVEGVDSVEVYLFLFAVVDSRVVYDWFDLNLDYRCFEFDSNYSDIG